jgi:EamA domain-containing membrane protein RarD
MVQERHNREERPHTSASQPQQRKDTILLISGVCIPISLLLFVLGGVLARSQTPGAGLMSFVLATLLFIGGVALFIMELVVRHASAKPR